MKKESLKRKRVTVTMPPDLYAVFHRFGQNKAWSDDKTGAQLIGACFNGSVYALLRGEKHPVTKKDYQMGDFLPNRNNKGD